jgi:hypothetical protein
MGKRLENVTFNSEQQEAHLKIRVGLLRRKIIEDAGVGQNSNSLPD